MRPDPARGVLARLPGAWAATARRRRLAFVTLLAPGAILAVVGAQILVSPPLMVAGVAWLAAAGAARWVSEPRFMALEDQGRADPVIDPIPSEETAP